jgi:hypothetical protein
MIASITGHTLAPVTKQGHTYDRTCKIIKTKKSRKEDVGIPLLFRDPLTDVTLAVESKEVDSKVLE